MTAPFSKSNSPSFLSAPAHALLAHATAATSLAPSLAVSRVRVPRREADTPGRAAIASTNGISVTALLTRIAVQAVQEVVMLVVGRLRGTHIVRTHVHVRVLSQTSSPENFQVPSHSTRAQSSQLSHPSLTLQTRFPYPRPKHERTTDHLQYLVFRDGPFAIDGLWYRTCPVG